ncbi:rRNA maturation RNase YbeY [Algoriphagus zhangzhouensis]|uniref:Endoribonuclease YbeY n=1 Tax=Algoriphagus zhangzhouensis TaxID=1073327 RepID=A0A1M7ZAY6_9BACT|nr:rRNA maturation RNase YbeY [Algoriphagus zhangzhouensis]TDY46970.1 rRNA maturation RNase YbeY [Algoriphagus zhangzhouensis]SHO62071.1 rRNA maturation RNase YbeY [Algoriphagus zhangzhouensis]
MAIHFFTEETPFQLKQKLNRKKWLKEIAKGENYSINDLNYIFCTDEYLYQINVEYLNHDTYTDIITFDNSEIENEIEADIFISVDRVKENASKLNVPIEDELSRVISHGLFHLMGYKDKKKAEAELMRSKEEFAINLYKKY